MSANLTLESDKTVVRKETTAVCISDLLEGPIKLVFSVDTHPFSVIVNVNGQRAVNQQQ